MAKAKKKERKPLDFAFEKKSGEEVELLRRRTGLRSEFNRRLVEAIEGMELDEVLEFPMPKGEEITTFARKISGKLNSLKTGGYIPSNIGYRIGADNESVIVLIREVGEEEE